MFKGFNIKYPEYEVTTPQTNLTYNIRSLNVQEEERLKGSLISPTKMNDHLNKCIYDALTQKPNNITSYDSFLRGTTLKDRDSLLYALYQITYEEIRNYDIICSSCKKSYPITIKISSTFNINYYPHNHILEKEIPVKLPISQGVTAYIKQPSLFDESIALARAGSSIGMSLDMLTETLIINKFQQDPIESGDSTIYTDREDIVDAYMSLPSKDKREIYKKYKEEFGQYGILLKMKSLCIHCGTQEEIEIDLVENFFRMVHST